MRCLAFFLLACFSAAAQVTDAPPGPLLDAAHCLAAASPNWINGAHHNATELELGYVSDVKSYSGLDLVYLVDYTTPTHSAGRVSTFVEHGKDPHRVVRFQFTIGFRQSDDGSGQMEVVDPPFGGISIQDKIVAAVRQVGFHTYSVPVTEFLNRSTRCESDPTAE